ncbi:MAG: hypothetical protein Q4C96_02675 [Planctomycetia bacterium]|nr:hypothetical protein [Planctomycetia bacterium]
MNSKIEMGLKIALILFVIIAITLGVTTFVFKKQRDEAYLERDDAQKNASTAQSELSKANEDIIELKRMMGYAEEGITEITSKFEEEMKRVAPQIEVPTFLSAIESMQKQINNLRDEAATKDKAMVELQKQFKTRDAVKLATMQKEEEKTKKILEEKNKIAADYKKSVDKTITDTASAVKLAETNTNKRITEIKEKESTIQKQFGLMAQKDETIKKTQDKLRALEEPILENPQGSIVYIEGDGQRGFINLGSTSGVIRGLSFGIYDKNDISFESLKGTVTIEKVMDARSSQVRIERDTELEEDIEEGDVILNPIWSPGKKEHFALAGVMSIHGRNDVQLVLNLIRQSGGIIDAHQDKDGNLHGRISDQTTCIIRGDAPTDASSDALRDNYTNMMDEAERLSIRIISLNDFLRKVAYKPSTTSREEAVRSSYRATTSTGSVSDLFSEENSRSRRTPPKTAY